ncbi:MAG: ABC transporter permease subunit [Planctomycetes bacterium]|nr:ABC transporter permease subunit [Planctomycetota bacterium]
MSVLQSCMTWFRRIFGWSTSRQSWQERLSFLALAAAAFGAWWFADRLTIFQQVLVWGLIVVAALVLLRRGWLTLFGPVLFYDMIRAGRRGRYFLLRCLYAGLLLFILLTTWLGLGNSRDEIQKATRFASNYFETFIVVQLVLVVILTPAYVAGAISEEKDRKTLEFLLATDLRNREIVLSKFGSRLANLTLFLLTGLPILGFLQFLGGVSPELVFSGFAATGLTMLGIASVSILCSVYFKKPRDAIGVTYLIVLTYHALSIPLHLWLKFSGTAAAELDVPIWFGAGAPTLFDAFNWLNAGNPIAAVIDIAQAQAMRVVAGGPSGIELVLPGIMKRYAVFHLVLTAICLLLAVARVRKLALRQAFGRTRKAGVRHRSRPAVGDLPMLWKEISVEGGMRINWAASIVLATLFLFSMSFGVWWTFYHFFAAFGEDPLIHEKMNAWVRIAGAIVAYLTLLGVAIRASTTIGVERDKQTLDSLLTSPLSSSSILWSKFLGAILTVRLGWVWLGLIWGLGLVTGGLHVLALPLLVAAWFIYATFFAILGLWFSMTAKTTMRATVYTMLVSIGLTFGHWIVWMCCIPVFLMRGPGTGEGLKYIAQFQLGNTPPFVIGVLSFIGENFSNNFGGGREMAEMMGFCILGLFIWGVMAMILWNAALVPRFRRFCGREEVRYPEGEPPPGERARRRRSMAPPPIPPEDDDWGEADDQWRERIRRD